MGLLHAIHLLSCLASSGLGQLSLGIGRCPSWSGDLDVMSASGFVAWSGLGSLTVAESVFCRLVRSRPLKGSSHFLLLGRCPQVLYPFLIRATDRDITRTGCTPTTPATRRLRQEDPGSCPDTAINK